MKTGQLFWGFFFLTIGTLFLLTKFSVIGSDWYFVSDLWPLLLILWGLYIIIKEKVVRGIVTVAFGILAATIIFGFFFGLWECSGIDDDWNYSHSHGNKEFYLEYDSEITEAQLELDCGVGEFYLNGTTEDLFEAKVEGDIVDYIFSHDTRDEQASVSLEMEDRDFNVIDDEFDNEMDIRLNPNPEWDVNLKFGAAKAYLNFTQHKLRNLDIETGAAKTKIKIGRLLDKVDIAVQMGVSKLDLVIPSDFGCKVRGDMVLMGKDFEGFIDKGSGTHVSENFERVGRKILIDIDGGISSLSIRRY